MKIFGKCACLGLFIVVGSRFACAQAPSACRASKLTDDDARILLYVTPAAVAARMAGTDVDMEQSQPSKQFPAADYFVATIVSQRPTSASVLGNGIVGNFVVDKRSAAVESLSNFTLVRGSELQRVQSWMRHGHCIRGEPRR
jgi:hypothetical protein